MRVQIPGIGADEFESLAVKLPDAEISEVLYLRIFPRHDFREIEINFPGAHAPRLRVFGEVLDFSGVEQRLRRHAAAQDAQSADFLAAFDDDGFQSRARRRPRRRVTPAAAADDRHVEIKSLHAGEDGSTERKCKFQI